MNFLYPQFLYALGLLSIPILIHLFNFRKYKKVYFTNVALLTELKEQTNTASKLKNLLILLCRLLAVAALVFAFAQPFLGLPKSNSQNQLVAIYIDNSPSMSIMGDNGKLLNEAQLKAKSVLAAFPENTPFIICNNSSSLQNLRVLTKNEAIDAIDYTREGNEVKSFSEIALRIKGIANEKKTQIYLVGDVQENSSDLPKLIADTLTNYTILPIQAKLKQNISIDSVWFASPLHLANASEELTVLLKNHGNKAIESANIELFINGKTVALGNTSIEAESENTVTLRYKNKFTGLVSAEVRLSDNSILFDNTYYLAYSTAQKLSIFELKGPESSTAFKQLFANDSDYTYQSFDYQNINYQALQAKGTLLVNGLKTLSTGLIKLIQDKLKAGEAVALIPPLNELDKASYNQLFAQLGLSGIGNLDTAKTKVAKLEEQNPFFKNLFEKIPANLNLPLVNGHYNGVKGAVNLLQLSNGDAFLSLKKTDTGSFFWLSAPLNASASNFAQHGLFVPCLLRIAETSTVSQEHSYTIGGKNPIKLNINSLPKELVVKMENQASKSTLIPTARKIGASLALYPQGLAIEPGNYTITADAELLGGVGLNLNRSESELTYLNEEDLDNAKALSAGRISVLQGKPSKITSLIKDEFEGYKLWLWFICATLLFLTTEMALTKWLK